MDEEADADNWDIMLLSDIRECFEGDDRVFSAVLVARLTALEDRPWADLDKGKALTQNGLAYRLKHFQIKPKRALRIGAENKRGYERAQFVESFERYLDNAPVLDDDETATSSKTTQIEAQQRNNVDMTRPSDETKAQHTDNDVALEIPPKRSTDADCCGVADENGDTWAYEPGADG